MFIGNKCKRLECIVEYNVIDGWQYVLFKATFKGNYIPDETIKVEISASIEDFEKENEEVADNKSKAEKEDDDCTLKKSNGSEADEEDEYCESWFKVEIDKENGTKLLFDCRFFPKKLCVRKITIEDKDWYSYGESK